MQRKLETCLHLNIDSDLQKYAQPQEVQAHEHKSVTDRCSSPASPAQGGRELEGLARGKNRKKSCRHFFLVTLATADAVLMT